MRRAGDHGRSAGGARAGRGRGGQVVGEAGRAWERPQKGVEGGHGMFREGRAWALGGRDGAARQRKREERRDTIEGKNSPLTHNYLEGVAQGGREPNKPVTQGVYDSLIRQASREVQVF